MRTGGAPCQWPLVPSGTLKADINITPLVDVVLVLLIIFMVITPLVQVGYDTKVPPKTESTLTPPPATDQIIIRMEGDGRIYINKEEVAERDFPNRLRDVLKNRESKVTFFAAAGDLPYDKVMHLHGHVPQQRRAEHRHRARRALLVTTVLRVQSRAGAPLSQRGPGAFI